MTKCFMSCKGKEFPSVCMPAIPRVGEIIIFENHPKAYRVKQVQHQFQLSKDRVEYVLVNVILVRSKKHDKKVDLQTVEA